MVTPDAKRKAVARACKEYGVSQRRACDILHVDRSSVRYQSACVEDTNLREAMKKVAAERRRFAARQAIQSIAESGVIGVFM
jgi:putative transposase